MCLVLDNILQGATLRNAIFNIRSRVPNYMRSVEQGLDNIDIDVEMVQ